MASSADPLSGMTVLVTGATRGIGRSVCVRLRERDARVIAVARSEDRLRAVADEFGAEPIPADVSRTESVHRLAERAAELLDGQPPDAVINAAGAFDLAPIAATSTSSFDRQIATNLRGPFLMMRAFLPGMLERGSGHFITLGSISGRTAFPHNGAYSASKFGVRGLHAVLAEEVRGTGVRATLIEPSATDTAIWDEVDREQNPGLPPKEAMLPPESVADAVVYALSRPTHTNVGNLILGRS